ncbi:hypothetical protein DOTSEDRAFT_71616 [Dothistroma septosporum NZE10]|uniref:N-acetyltransferase domain-containing protein n=1 Tax=Dothistroma septosporum (strain NZE10 / CBS 128990) TaxID=675120 RepID=N1PK22_DOTSN|nr:hypothetical protein DOTSEDRAFT_71616 [Dothistroma septosporum NZE10]
MPRDLSALADESTLSNMPDLSKTSQEDTKREAPMDADTGDESESESSIVTERSQSNSRRDELHPYTQTLNLSHVESCTTLEEATFPPQERCTREKFQYRLKYAGELSLGIFTSKSASDADVPTAESAAPVYSGAPERKAVLLGHIVSTKTTNAVVSDEDMAMGDPSNPKVGHKQAGRTVCIHSLAVLPQYQGRGLGKTLMKAYIHRLENQDVADHVALITHEALIPYYKQFGFVSKGKSEAQFGGGGWYDMAKELKACGISD